MTKHPAPSAAPHVSAARESVSGSVQIVCNGEPRAIAPGTSVAGLVQELALSPRQIAVEVNLQLIPRGQHQQHLLVEGDRVEIVSLVGGG